MKWIARVLIFTAALALGIFAASLYLFGEPAYIFSSMLFDTPCVQVLNVEVPVAAEAKAEDVSVCDLKNDPARYNHASVKVSGYFSRGFEDSTLYDPGCKSDQWIWVELGGKRSIDVMYCCGSTPKPTRDEELEVEGIKLPLTEDANFEKYNKFLADGKNVKATVIGTYFSGERIQYSKELPVFYGGYGHMGIGSLFVVQQVRSVELTKTKDRF
jgi:hypothetical protein